ncbi:hypothetical protein OQA88_9094 [Cercophora sp. LCS_1]
MKKLTSNVLGVFFDERTSIWIGEEVEKIAQGKVFHHNVDVTGCWWVAMLRFKESQEPYNEVLVLLERQTRTIPRGLSLEWLLVQEMPGAFRAPPVLGYTKMDVPAPAFGLVLGRPSGGQEPTRLSTLRGLIVTAPLPSLSRRFKLCAVLANAIANFHSVQWLHKGVRSDSVLFFTNENEEVDITLPYLSGFDLSRPDAMDTMPQRPSRCPPRDMYRHPDVQSVRGGGTRYRKCYDWYSFGIALIEIALWESIDTVLKLGEPEKMTDLDLYRIRSCILGKVGDNRATKLEDDNQKLLASDVLRRVAAHVGDAYSEMVELCLRADEIQASNRDGISEESLSFQLDVVMSKSVVRKFQALDLVF